MAKFTVTSPEGDSYEVNAPPGATQADAVNYVRREVAAGRLQPQRRAAPAAPPRSALASAVKPIADLPGEVMKSSREANAALAEDYREVTGPTQTLQGLVRGDKPRTLGHRALYAGKGALDALNYPFAPVEGAINALASKPIEANTGVPAALSTALIQLVTPFLGMKKPPKMTQQEWESTLRSRLKAEGRTGWSEGREPTPEELDQAIEAITKTPRNFDGKPIKSAQTKAKDRDKQWLTPEEITGDPNAGTFNDFFGNSVEQSQNEMQRMRRGERSGASTVLPVVPSEVHAGVANNASARPGAEGQSAGSGLRERVQAPWQANPAAVPGVRGNGLPDAPPGLQQAAGGGVAVPEMPSGLARSEPRPGAPGASEQAIPAQEFPEATYPDLADSRAEPRIKDQGGKIDLGLAAKVAGTAGGAVVGAGLDPENPLHGAVLGAAGGFGVGHVVSKRVATGGFGSALRVATNEGALLHNAKEAEIAAGMRAASQTYERLKAAKIPADRGFQIIRAIETGDFSALTPVEVDAAKLFAQEVGRLGTAAQEAGVIQRLKGNYVPLLFDWKDKKTAETLKRMGAQDPSKGERQAGFSTFTPFQLERTIDDYGVAASLGLKPRTTDLAELFGTYANSVIRATENKRAITELANLKDATGKPLVEMRGAAPKDFVPINKGDVKVPELDGMMVHPDIAESVRLGLTSYDPSIIARSAQNVSWFAKRFNVAISAFHPMALLQAYTGAGGNPFGVMAGMATKGLKGATGVDVGYRSAVDKALDAYRTGGAGDMIDYGIRNGLKIEAPIEDRAGRDAFRSTMKVAADKANDLHIPGGDIPFKTASAVDAGLQKFTWDYLYTGMKLSTFSKLFEQEVQRNMAAAAAGKEPLRNLNEIATDVASFTNSTFGGLNMRRIAEDVAAKWGEGLKVTSAARIAATPRGQAYLQMALFAPDWKMSTLQSWTRGLGVTGNSEALQRMHREYLVRSAFITLVINDSLNYKMSGHHIWENDFHTKRGHNQTLMEKVHDATFVDFGDGRRMQTAKHLMEGPHAVSDPQKFALNALGFLPRTGLEMLTNKQFLTPDWAPPIAENYMTPAQKAYLYATHPLRNAMPIFGQQFDAGLGPTLGSFAGLPIYGLTQEQKAELARKRQEDRAKALENR